MRAKQPLARNVGGRHTRLRNWGLVDDDGCVLAGNDAAHPIAREGPDDVAGPSLARGAPFPHLPSPERISITRAVLTRTADLTRASRHARRAVVASFVLNMHPLRCLLSGFPYPGLYQKYQKSLSCLGVGTRVWGTEIRALKRVR